MLVNREFRLTRQRKIILDELRSVTSHPTASEIYDMVRRRLPRISLGTVYRNLELLCEHGLIRKLELVGTQRRFDRITKNHYHVRCLRCGQVDDAPVEPVAALENKLRAVSDYEIVGHRLEFVGLCPKCKRNQKRARKSRMSIAKSPKSRL